MSRPICLCCALLVLTVPAEVSAQEKARPQAAAAKSVEAIAEQIKPSLVKIVQVGRVGMDGLGSGFVVDSEGLIATNLHVIGEARQLEVETSNGETHEVVEITATDSHWDLALLRIDKKGLKPLPLGDSDSVRQGAAIVAMGNPQGLAFSIVEGVVSAIREINEIPMIQLALPIERGNSGGPLLDRQGHVVGILTLKSARTENLGFAMPVNELKSLIEKPNPVPMKRWLTIGVLNPKWWKPLMGARWSQHAGVIQAATPGSGFGGRSVCLWLAEKPQDSFEALVNVRLDDESGAAGLVFCADGSDRHYGFYPSGGKLRLTRFDGPDVYSWTILADVTTDAYRPGDWNQLRVRVEPQRLVCFVNGKQVLEQFDSGLRGGSAGLCKFRNTKAEFRGFRLGSDLAEKPVDPQLAAGIRAALDAYLHAPETRNQTLDALLPNPSLSRKVLVETRRKLEQEVATVRDLEKELHRRNMEHELLTELAKPEDKIDLIRCTLVLSRHDNPEVDITQYLGVVGRMVDELKADAEIQKGGRAAVERLTAYLFEENGFHGSRHDYENRSNSYMNEVLDDREGLPITLAVLYMELAARLGIHTVFGVPLPEKFMVGYKEAPEGELTLIDVFERGQCLTVEQAALQVSDSSQLPEEFLQPATKREVVLRILRNLVGIALEDESEAKEAMGYLNLILAIDPRAAIERITRARLNQRLGQKAAASEDVEWLVKNLPVDASQLEQLDQWRQSLRQ